MRTAAICVIAAVALALSGCAQARPDPLPGYRSASPDERAAVVGVVSQYFAIRNSAAITGDVGPLYRAHPSLASGQDQRTGVNSEASFIQRMRALGVVRVSVDLEDREPVKVFLKDAAAVAFVHGRETWDLPPGTGQTISEIIVRIDLQQGTDGWHIERTDQLELGERVSPTPS